MTEPELIEEARRRYAEGSDDNIEVDDDAQFSHLDGEGCWVSGWLWVKDDE